MTSVVHLAKRVVRHMVANHRGKILITSSLSATLPTPYETVYGPTRAFTYMFAEALREELKGTGVSVTRPAVRRHRQRLPRQGGMNNTAFGPSMKKNSRIEVARQGFEALLAGKNHVVAGDRATKRVAIKHRLLPEKVKAARHARMARPRQ